MVEPDLTFWIKEFYFCSKYVKKVFNKESWSIGLGFGLALKGSVILQAGQVKSDK